MWGPSNDSAAAQKAVASGKRGQKRAMHPRNKYAEKAPDFTLLAEQYPSFKEYVTYGSNKKPRIDWTDFNATRELTRVLLEHDYGIKWWIPDGQLCPTVPNRANYIHWIEDLLSVSPAPWHAENPSQIRGIDIGTGANCIYPLLGAALNGWHFVGTDVTSVALEWAQRNVQENPQLSEYIEVRRAGAVAEVLNVDSSEGNCQSTTVQNLCVSPSQEVLVDKDGDCSLSRVPIAECDQDLPVDDECLHARTEDEGVLCGVQEEHSDPCRPPSHNSDENPKPRGKGAPAARDSMGGVQGNAPLLLEVIHKSENYDFCMCNPPFFESMEEAGLNPQTACGGTSHEMVYPGGELAFITRIVEESLQLERQIQWYTSMVGRKVNLRLLMATLRANGVTILRTTEFVQGRTSRWGIAWSFSPVQKHTVAIPGRVLGKSSISFMLEGIDSKCSAWEVLQALAHQLRVGGATVNIDPPTFSLMGALSAEEGELHAHNSLPSGRKLDNQEIVLAPTTTTTKGGGSQPFRATVFQQVPGTLLIKASLSKGSGPSGMFSLLFEQVELALKKQFMKTSIRS